MGRSQGLFGGNRCDASSLNTLACWAYFSSTLTLAMYCSTCLAKSVDMELIVLSPVRMSTIHCFASSVTVCPMRVLSVAGSVVIRALLIDSLSTNVYQSGDLMTTGSIWVST